MAKHDVRVRVIITSTIAVEADNLDEAKHIAARREPYDVAEYYLRFARRAPRISLEVMPDIKRRNRRVVP